MKKYSVEFIGTFFFLLIIFLTSNNYVGKMVPFVIGSTLMVMVFAGRHVSDGKYNPTVTINVWIHGRCKTAEILGNITGQLPAVLTGAITGKYLSGLILRTKINACGTFNFIGDVFAEFLGRVTHYFYYYKYQQN